MRKQFPKEMSTLRCMLSEKEIEWADASTIISDELLAIYEASGMEETSIFRTRFEYKNHLYSVISGFGTYGGGEGLLEIGIDVSETGFIKGWLTAENVMEIIDNPEKAMKEEGD